MDFAKKILITFLGAITALTFWLLYTEEKTPELERDKSFVRKIDEKKEKQEKEEELTESYTLLFVGDVMLDRGVRIRTKEHGDDYTFPFLKIADKLNEGDVLFGNLESIISDKGQDVGGKYSFRAEPEAMEGLVYAGFDVVSLANNHAFDWGREAFEDTMQRLTDVNIKYTGAGFNYNEAHSVKTISLGEGKLRVGFLGYTDFLFPYAIAQETRSGVTDFSEENIVRDIEKFKDKVDVLVVTFHYGTEYEKEPNQNQKKWSRLAVDAGANLVIGHHPHVTQPVEKYNGAFIAYSLGNFIFDQYFSEETMRGFMLEVKVKETGKIIGINKLHYKLNEKYQPYFTEKEVVFEK